MFRTKYIEKRKTAWSGGITKHIAAIILCLTMLSYGTQVWGYKAPISADDGTALGTSADNTAVGVDSTATGTASTAVGGSSSATGTGSTAYGWTSNASGEGSTATGNSSKATGAYSTAYGWNSNASNYYATAIGVSSNASGEGSTATGNSSKATGYYSTATGGNSSATGTYSVSIGWQSTASNAYSTAIGNQAISTGNNSVAIGAYSNDDDQVNVVSVGSSTGTAFTRKITNVTAGTLSATSTDAVNGAQLYAVQQQTDTLAVRYDDASKGVITLDPAGTKVSNVAAGTANTDAANVGQLNSSAAATLTSAKDYTNRSIAVNNTSGYADPSATGNDSIAVGGGAVASAANTVAVGSNARATGTNAIAIGSGATATGSVALGTSATASNGGSAFGDYTTSTGTNSTAIGYGATSTGSNSAAIGSNSTDDGQENVVSMGSTGNERRITNVAAGVNDTDAVNVSQLNAVSTNIASEANAYTDRRIDDLSDEAHRGIAGAIALSRAIMSLNPGESGISAGFGESGGQGAVALSFQHNTKGNIQFNIGASFDTSNVQVGGGIGIKF